MVIKCLFLNNIFYLFFFSLQTPFNNYSTLCKRVWKHKLSGRVIAKIQGRKSGCWQKICMQVRETTFRTGSFRYIRRVCVCVCVCVGLVLSDNTLTGLRLLKDRIKADTQDTPTRPAKDITAMLLAPPSIANWKDICRHIFLHLPQLGSIQLNWTQLKRTELDSVRFGSVWVRNKVCMT